MESRGYSLRTERDRFARGQRTTWRFEVIGPYGRPNSYRVQHERELHLIVVRNDLLTFAHLHPARDPDGTWTVDLSLPKAGRYTAFADVAPDDAEPMTLKLGLTVDGEEADDVTFSPSTIATPDDYRVELLGDARAGEGSHVEFVVSRNGESIEPDPYLGAAGHLVAIRIGDLEYLHVHPMDSVESGSIPFMIHAHSPGRYRLFLQFLHDGILRTADFTLDVS